MSESPPRSVRKRASRARRKPSDRAGKTVRLRPANPFDLIRVIASSQSDPRKAVAELVQNSLDAGARHITVVRGVSVTSSTSS